MLLRDVAGKDAVVHSTLAAVLGWLTGLCDSIPWDAPGGTGLDSGSADGLRDSLSEADAVGVGVSLGGGVGGGVGASTDGKYDLEGNTVSDGMAAFTVTFASPEAVGIGTKAKAVTIAKDREGVRVPEGVTVPVGVAEEEGVTDPGEMAVGVKEALAGTDGLTDVDGVSLPLMLGDGVSLAVTDGEGDTDGAVAHTAGMGDHCTCALSS